MEKPAYLVVEDDDVDVLLIKRAFKAIGGRELCLAGDGKEALELLRAELDKPNPRAFIVLLDLNMPRMNGIEFLEELRSDVRLHETVVFVHTTSTNPRDIEKAYAHHVAGYTVKQFPGRNQPSIAEFLGQYERHVRLPPASAVARSA